MHLTNDVNPEIPYVVGKAAIVIAWADGNIQPEEITCLKGMLENAPNIPNGRMERLNDLLLSPMQDIECDVAAEKLVALLHNKEERNFAIYWLNQMANASGKANPIEDKLHKDMVSRLMGKTATSVPPFSESIRGKKKKDVCPTTHADEILNVWISNIREHILDLKIDDEPLNEMVTIGLLTAKVIMADNRIEDSEARAIQEYFCTKWGVSKDSAAILSKILLAQDIEDEHDIMALCRRLQSKLTEKEILAIMNSILDISAREEGYNEEETNDLISIAAALNVDHNYFIKRLTEPGCVPA